VPEDQLPVELPYVDEFRPTGTDQSPLALVDSYVNTTCPSCGGAARRETDVCDTFLDSSWYYLRYPSTEFDDRPFDAALTKKWLPVHMYIGGKEHSVLHLLYSRFITMALHDMGQVAFEEPFHRFRAHGMLILRGAKISKSRGNIVNPDDYVASHGADTLRAYLMFSGRYEEGGDFSDHGIEGVYRFLHRVWELVQRYLWSDGCDVHWHLMRQAWMSPANLAVAPVQDLLGLGSEHRMNRPGTAAGNWSWRLQAGLLDEPLAARLHELTSTYGRLPQRR